MNHFLRRWIILPIILGSQALTPVCAVGSKDEDVSSLVQSACKKLAPPLENDDEENISADIRRVSSGLVDFANAYAQNSQAFTEPQRNAAWYLYLLYGDTKEMADEKRDMQINELNETSFGFEKDKAPTLGFWGQKHKLTAQWIPFVSMETVAPFMGSYMGGMALYAGSRTACYRKKGGAILGATVVAYITYVGVAYDTESYVRGLRQAFQE